MEELLRKNIKQSIPTHSVVFIIINIIVLFIVIITVLLLFIRGLLVDNFIHVDYIATGLVMILGNLVLIITSIASIRDYKKAILGCLEDIKEVDEYCENVIKEAIKEDNETEEDDFCMYCYELCDNCEIFKEKIKEN